MPSRFKKRTDMSLSKKDKEAVKALWSKASKNLDVIGAEAFGR